MLCPSIPGEEKGNLAVLTWCWLVSPTAILIFLLMLPVGFSWVRKDHAVQPNRPKWCRKTWPALLMSNNSKPVMKIQCAPRFKDHPRVWGACTVPVLSKCRLGYCTLKRWTEYPQPRLPSSETSARRKIPRPRALHLPIQAPQDRSKRLG